MWLLPLICQQLINVQCLCLWTGCTPLHKSIGYVFWYSCSVEESHLHVPLFKTALNISKYGCIVACMIDEHCQCMYDLCFFVFILKKGRDQLINDFIICTLNWKVTIKFDKCPRTIQMSNKQKILDEKPTFSSSFNRVWNVLMLIHYYCIEGAIVE